MITGAASGIGATSARMFAAEGARVVGVDLNPSDSEGELAIAGRRHRRGPGRGDVRAGARRARPHRRALQQRRHQPHRRHLGHRDHGRGLAAGPGRQRALGVFLCCKHGIPPPARNRRRLGDQHGLVRGRDGRRGLADLLHGLEGRRAGDVARDGGRVRPPRGARQRALPGPGQHAAAAGAVRQRSRRRPRAGWSTCRWAASARPRRSPTPAIFLASDESSYVTASTFLVDGGLSGAYLTPETGE